MPACTCPHDQYCPGELAFHVSSVITGILLDAEHVGDPLPSAFAAKLTELREYTRSVMQDHGVPDLDYSVATPAAAREEQDNDR